MNEIIQIALRLPSGDYEIIETRSSPELLQLIKTHTELEEKLYKGLCYFCKQSYVSTAIYITEKCKYTIYISSEKMINIIKEKIKILEKEIGGQS